MFVIAIDVGGPNKIGWAASDGCGGSGADLKEALVRAGEQLAAGQTVAIGFEAPIWTPRRDALARVTSRRGGAEIVFNRPWSAGAGCGVLGAGLGLMPWCFSQITAQTPVRVATTDRVRFVRQAAGLLVWEAFVSGHAKALSHQDDAALALEAFLARGMVDDSDVPAEPAINLAAAALLATGWDVDVCEVGRAGHVVAADMGQTPIPV